MTREQLKELRHARPFHPFAIHMGDGRVFLVKDPHYISWSPSGRTLIVHEEGERFSILDMAMVTRLEVHPSAWPGDAA